MFQMSVRWIVLILAVYSAFGHSASAQLAPSTFSPNGRVISPFGFGQVLQYLSQTSTNTGSSLCQGVSTSLTCLSVSNGLGCQSQLVPGALVSCNSKYQPAVNTTPFSPTNCNGHAAGDGGASGLLGSGDWCLIANYMPSRSIDTLYQFDDYVRLGVNKRFGGMVTELYGTDMIDRILQAGGGGVQMSLWAFTASYAPAFFPRAYFAVPVVQNGTQQPYDPTGFASMAACQAVHPGSNCVEGVEGPNAMPSQSVFPCGGNGEGAGAPLNPIQGQSTNCDYGTPPGVVTSVSSMAPGQITVSKTNPANFSRSDSVSWLRWNQTTQVQGPAAIVTYNMSGTATTPDSDFQEIPAIFLHQGLGENIYYYTGPSPYSDAGSAVTTANIRSGGVYALQLPKRIGPFGTGANAQLTEDWLSACDATSTSCVTVATFSGTAQDIIAAFSPNGSYFGIHGFFSLTNNLNRTASVMLFPYRFDDIVQGRSIRQWIYSFRSNPAYSK